MLMHNGKRIVLLGEPFLARRFEVSKDPTSNLKIRGWIMVERVHVRYVKDGRQDTVDLADCYEPSEPAQRETTAHGQHRRSISLRLHDET